MPVKKVHIQTKRRLQIIISFRCPGSTFSDRIEVVIQTDSMCTDTTFVQCLADFHGRCCFRRTRRTCQKYNWASAQILNHFFCNVFNLLLIALFTLFTKAFRVLHSPEIDFLEIILHKIHLSFFFLHRYCQSAEYIPTDTLDWSAVYFSRLPGESVW